MSMTITLCLEDEEHTLVVDPGSPNDYFIDILRNILGHLHDCKFTVDDKAVANADEILKQLHNNAIINATRHSRATYTSLGPRGFPLEIKSPKNPARPIIKLESLHISCSSDPYDKNENMAGLIVYSFDNKQIFELNGHRCRTGYILIKATKNISHIKSNQGIVHGSLFKWFFGIEPDDRFVGAGFALHDSKLKYNSGTFNARNDDYHDNNPPMSADETYLIRYAVENLYKNDKWKVNPTVSLSSMTRSIYNPGDNLPPQNHPKYSQK